MAKIDESFEFKPLRIATLTVSDTREKATDKSGDVLEAMIGEAGHTLAKREIVTDDRTANPRQGGKLDRRRRASTSSSPRAAPASPDAT